MADWKKVAVSGSDISQFNNDSGYITSATSNHAFATASFNGTNLVANSTDGTLNFTSGSGGQLGILITANAGTDTLDFSLGANSVKNAALLNDSVTIGSTEINLGATATTITGLTSVTSTGFTGTLSATSVLADGVTATTQTAGDSSTKVATTAFVAAAATAADLDLVGDGSTTTAVDLDSQTLTFAGQDGLQLSASAQTITATIANGGIANAKLANSTISGKALGTQLDNLIVDNATLNLNTGTTYNGAAARTISIKDGGVDTAAIADSLGTLGVNQFTGSFSGSFTGDVDINLADLTDGFGISNFTYDGNAPASVSVQADSTTGGNTVPVAVSSNGVGLDLSTIDGTGISVFGSELRIDFRQADLTGLTAAGPDQLSISSLSTVIATDGANRILTSDGDGTLTAEPNFTFNGTDLLVTGNERITGNLVVEGTASFQNQENLQVADRFILMASGSATAGDGGIVVQQGTQDVGELFGFDANLTRWAITSSFDASLSTFVPDAFMATAIEGAGIDPDATPARYDKKGNIFVGTDQGIWIYS
tara:strand:- start:2255 stop:3877 length:1623 start_codon:yes stop_codon:yes gene_type:complete